MFVNKNYIYKEIAKNVGSELKQARKAKGLTQKEVAKQFFMTINNTLGLKTEFLNLTIAKLLRFVNFWIYHLMICLAFNYKKPSISRLVDKFD
jgi:transcriptional regulator with XRE-family HTH domain